MRLTGVAALAAATAALCASCTSAVRPASAPATGALSPGLSSAGSAAQPTAGPVARQGNVRVPGFSTAVARAPRLTGVRTAMVPVAGDPFAAAPAGRWPFVSVPSSSIIGFRAGSSLPPTLAFSLPVTSQALGEAITHDGRYLLAASASGVLVIGVARAEHGSSNAVLGSLTSLTSLTSPAAAGAAGAIEVAVSRDDRVAFVSLEDSDEIAVFALNRALAHGFGPADFVGTIPVGEGPVGMAASPDGQWLYATSEVERGMRPSVNVPGNSRRGTSGTCPDGSGGAAWQATLRGVEIATSDGTARVELSEPAGELPVTGGPGAGQARYGRVPFLLVLTH